MGGNSVSLVSLMYGSFPTSRHSSPTDGSSGGERRPKRSRAKGGTPIGSSRQFLPMQVTSNHEGEKDLSVCISGEERGLTTRPKVQQVMGTLVVVAVTSSSSFGELRPPLKKVCTMGCLPPSARYVHVGCCTLLM
jgi:hypothetical protein